MKQLSILFAALLLLAGQVGAQCTPDPQYPNSGIYPTPVQTGLITVPVNTPWSQTLTLNVPADTMIQPLPTLPSLNVTVNFQEVTGITGLPPGVNYVCDPPNCNWLGGSTGCIEISGTPTTTGQYTFAITGNLNVTIPPNIPIVGGTVQNVPTPVPYQMEVTGATSIDPGNLSSFQVGQNAPNPFAGQTRIQVYLPYASDLHLEIYDLSGKMVQSDHHSNLSGMQEIEVDAAALQSGVYFYRVSNGQESQVNKMIIAQ